MRPIITPAEVVALEAAAFARGIDAATLMERAGHAVARAALALAGGRYGRRITVVCGGGNNGGDGFVAARLLRSWGVAVSVVTVGEPTTREPAASARRAAVAAGVWLSPFADGSLARELERSDAAVDAVVGMGFAGPARGEVASAIAALDDSTCPVLAVDVPSGLDDGVGRAEERMAVHADATVTFGALKTSLLARSDRTGPVEVVDIGLPADEVPGGLCLVEASDVASLLPHRAPYAHKRDAVVILIGGSLIMPGAIALAASGAMRGGAGLVRVAVPSEIVPVLASLVPSATFIAMPQTDTGGIAGDGGSFREALADADSVVIGPGAGRHEATARWIRGLVTSLEVPAVLDADGLWAFTGESLAAGSAGLVCTPHAGEAARLLGPSDPSPDNDRVGAARILSSRTGAVVLLKGAGTVVSSPNGLTTVNPTGGPSLATAGTGDVLSGLIGAMLARGLAPDAAAMVGAYVHGLAGDILAARVGESATAEDLSSAIPAALAELSAA